MTRDMFDLIGFVNELKKLQFRAVGMKMEKIFDEYSIKTNFFSKYFGLTVNFKKRDNIPIEVFSIIDEFSKKNDIDYVHATINGDGDIIQIYFKKDAE